MDMDADSRQDVEEAIEAGRKAFKSLRMVRDRLEEAETWGTLDLFGGKIVTTYIKHSEINYANKFLEVAKRDLEAFDKELKKLSDTYDIEIDTDDFLAFVDQFLDLFIADWLMQNRIEEALTNVRRLMVEVNNVLNQLKCKIDVDVGPAVSRR